LRPPANLGIRRPSSVWGARHASNSAPLAPLGESSCLIRLSRIPTWPATPSGSRVLSAPLSTIPGTRVCSRAVRMSTVTTAGLGPQMLVRLGRALKAHRAGARDVEEHVFFLDLRVCQECVRVVVGRNHPVVTDRDPTVLVLLVRFRRYRRRVYHVLFHAVAPLGSPVRTATETGMPRYPN